MGNQCGDAVKEGRNVGIAVEMAYGNGIGNDKLKELRKVKIIDNEHICKNLVPDISSGVFLVSVGHISHNVFVFIIDFEQVNASWEAK